MHIFLIGFMGAGKSHWGRSLSDLLTIPFYDLDEVIVKEEGKSVTEIFAEKGENYFRKKEKEKLLCLSQLPDSIIACGGGTPCFFDNMQLMNQNGITVWLNAAIPVLVKRVLLKKHKRPLIAHLSNEELTDFMEKKLSERKIFYEQAQIVIDTEKMEVNDLIKILRLKK